MKNVNLVVIMMMVFSTILNAQETQIFDELSSESNLLDLSLEELMNLEVKVGTISGSSSKDLPVSVTTITKEQIELSTAPNLLHMIQLYVPGATYWRRSEGALLGFRGIMSDRNSKFLLTINGLVANQKAHNGVVTELEDWDMDDIERVDIIRGPGSVTYGPGAIAGVINIVTKAAGSQEGLKVSTNYATKYNSKGFKASYGFKKENISGYFHGSVTSTKGFEPDGKFLSYSTKNDLYLIGSLGDSTGLSETYLDPIGNYMKDFEDQPQLKFLGTVDFWNNTFTARYNRSGGTIGGYHLRQDKRVIGFDDDGERTYGDYEDISQETHQQLILSLKNKHQFEFADISLESEVAFIGGDYKRTHYWINRYNQEDFEKLNAIKPVNSLDNPLNLRQNFSENSWVAKTMGLYKINDKYKVAAGIEYVNTKFGKGWGDDARSFRMGEDLEFVNGPDSWALYNGSNNSIDTTTAGGKILGEDYFFIGDGWRTSDLGFVVEANLQFTPLFNLILSGRMDKNTYSDWLFSPRVAVVSKLNNKNTLKLVVQRSQRVSNAEELYKANKFESPNKSEKVDNMEMIYTGLLNDNMMLHVSGYYNKQDALGKERTKNEVSEVASVETAGIDIDYRVQYYKFNAGISYAFVKCLDYDYKGVGSYSPISFAEYNTTINGETFDIGAGNNLLNIANHSAQLYADRYFLDKRLILHTELSVLWDYAGNKDVQTVAARKSYKDVEAAQEIYNLYQRAFDDYGFFGPTYFWNASVTGKITPQATLTIGVNNIMGGESAKIYHGWDLNSPNYYVEPRNYVARFTYNF